MENLLENEMTTKFFNFYGLSLADINSETTNKRLVPRNKKGNKIKIKKENVGKFTDYCGGKVTQDCIDKGKKSNNPKIVKRAIFEDNARK